MDVAEARKRGMPGGQWRSLVMAIVRSAERLRTWQSTASLQRSLGQPVTAFCPAHQPPGLSAHFRLTAGDFNRLHAACLGDQAVLLPRLDEIRRLQNAYAAAIRKLDPHAPVMIII
jgi:hypothetical protein